MYIFFVLKTLINKLVFTEDYNFYNKQATAKWEVLNWFGLHILLNKIELA